MIFETIFKLWNSPTIGDRLRARGGIGPSFDAMRLGLALIILLSHAKLITGSANSTLHLADGAVVITGFSRPLKVALVPIFFALSGFLVTGSALRLHQLKPFFMARALRIFPALTIEVALSALVLGPIFTALPLKDYFSSSEFFSYFGNILGFVHFELPGVFKSNPSTTVNANLWTLPSEFYCYLILGIALALGFLRRPQIFLSVIFVMLAAALAASLLVGFCVTPGIYPTPVIVIYFLIGAALFILRDQLPANWTLFFLSAALAYLSLMLPQAIFVSPVFVVYCTICLGTSDLLRWDALKQHDYSYGIYLYGYPIAQALLTTFPIFRGHPYPFMLLAALSTVCFAAASWTWIEKPMLMLKKRRVKPGPDLPEPMTASAPLPQKGVGMV